MNQPTHNYQNRSRDVVELNLPEHAYLRKATFALMQNCSTS